VTPPVRIFPEPNPDQRAPSTANIPAPEAALRLFDGAARLRLSAVRSMASARPVRSSRVSPATLARQPHRTV
jgi:hypothetical protein